MDMIIMIGIIFNIIWVFPSSIIAGDAILAAKPKTAAVFGGGAAGLTAAMELREAGFNVKLYEKEDEYGGQMRGFVDKRGYPREHSLRIYSAKYFALGDVFDRAGLEPPMAEEEDVARWRNMKYNIPGTSTGYSSDPTEIAMKMFELDFFPSEFQYLVFQVAAWKQVPVEMVNALYNVRFEDFLDTGLGFEAWKGITGCVEGTVSPTVYCVPEHTPAFHAFVARLIGQIIAAKPEDSTPGVMYSLQLLFRTEVPPVTPQCTDYFQYFNGAYLATGPTSHTAAIRTIYKRLIEGRDNGFDGYSTDGNIASGFRHTINEIVTNTIVKEVQAVYHAENFSNDEVTEACKVYYKTLKDKCTRRRRGSLEKQKNQSQRSRILRNKRKRRNEAVEKSPWTESTKEDVLKLISSNDYISSEEEMYYPPSPFKGMGQVRTARELEWRSPLLTTRLGQLDRIYWEQIATKREKISKTIVLRDQGYMSERKEPQI